MKKLTVLAVLALLLLGGKARASLEGLEYVNSYFGQLTKIDMQIMASNPTPSWEAAQAMEQLAFQGDLFLVTAIQNGWLDFTSPKEQYLFMANRLQTDGWWSHTFYYQTGDIFWLTLSVKQKESAAEFLKLVQLAFQMGQ